MTPEPTKFRASHLKVKRAETHLVELTTHVNKYRASGPLKLIWEPVPKTHRAYDLWDDDTQLIGLTARIKSPVPENLAPIIGDIIQNLRSALDIMQCELVRIADANAGASNVYFPFWKSHTGSERAAALKRAKSSLLGDRYVELVDALQPYLGSQSGLYAIAQLSNRDKHRALIPTMYGVQYSMGSAGTRHRIPPGDTIVDPFPMRKAASEGKIFQVMQSDRGVRSGTVEPCDCLLGIAGADDLDGIELIDGLGALVEVVHAALICFDHNLIIDFKDLPPRQPYDVGNGVWVCPPEMTHSDIEKWVVKRSRNAHL